MIKLAIVLLLLSFRCHGNYPDWIPTDDSSNLCNGYYQPLAPIVDNFNPDTYPITVSANESEFTFYGQSLLRGSVALKQGQRYLYTDEIIIERSPSTKSFAALSAKGNIQFLTPSFSVFGDYARYEPSPQHFSFINAHYRWYPRNARGVAKAIEVDSDGNIHLDEGSYTTCAPYQDTWLLSAKKLSLYTKKGRASAKHIRFDYLQVPIFYFPYFTYPIDNKRHTGILFPSYGTTSSSGYEFTIPFYWNIAPNQDMTISGHYLTQRGVEMQTKYRYLLPGSQGTMQWHILPDDRKYGLFQRQNRLSPPGGLSFLDPRIVALDGTNTRQAVNYRHVTQWKRSWLFNVHFDYVSDDNYFVDLGNDINSASMVQLPQQANLSYFGDNWSHYFNIEEYQVLQPLSKDITEEIYKRQPQWVFQATYPNVYWFTFGLNGEMVNFNHLPSLITLQPVTTGQRYHLRPSISAPFTQSWYYIMPRVQIDWLTYELKLGPLDIDQNIPSSPSRSIPMYSIDSGLFFERPFHFKKYLGQQTLEPRLFYLYVPYRDQHLYPDFDSGVINFSYAQLFRDNRFSGRDRVGDTNQLSASLTTRLIPDGIGHEWLRASIGQIFYFTPRRVSLCSELEQEVNVDDTCFVGDDINPHAHHSNIISQAELHANHHWTAGMVWEWDSVENTTEQASFSVQYLASKEKLINFNYYWLKHDLGQVDVVTGETKSLHQADASVLFPVTARWKALSLWRYDLIKRQTVEVLGGFEYMGCCTAFQLFGSRYRISNNFFYPNAYATGVFAQIVFKGLCTLAPNNPDARLAQKIPGYTPLSSRQVWQQREQNRIYDDNIPLY